MRSFCGEGASSSCPITMRQAAITPSKSHFACRESHESVRIVEFPGLPEKGDVSDWLAAGGTRDELSNLANAASVWTPPAAAQAWPELMTFDALDLPEFPTHVLPPVLRAWVEAESHATQTPADLAAMLALSVCSAMIARLCGSGTPPGFSRASEPIFSRTAATRQP